jgi:hypothetical protein
MTDVEILYFDGCPNYPAASALVDRIADELGVETDVRLVRVDTPEAAQRLGFLGSPTVRVNGSDVEPGAERRHDHALACRVYRTATGTAGLPDSERIRAALRETGS